MKKPPSPSSIRTDLKKDEITPVSQETISPQVKDANTNTDLDTRTVDTNTPSSPVNTSSLNREITADFATDTTTDTADITTDTADITTDTADITTDTADINQVNGNADINQEEDNSDIIKEKDTADIIKEKDTADIIKDATDGENNIKISIENFSGTDAIPERKTTLKKVDINTEKENSDINQESKDGENNVKISIEDFSGTDAIPERKTTLKKISGETERSNSKKSLESFQREFRNSGRNPRSSRDEKRFHVGSISTERSFPNVSRLSLMKIFDSPMIGSPKVDENMVTPFGVETPRSIEGSRRLTFAGKREKEVLIGTPVREGHANYVLMYDMLTGIRISVRF
jgi:hypothetical protein